MNDENGSDMLSPPKLAVFILLFMFIILLTEYVIIPQYNQLIDEMYEKYDVVYIVTDKWTKDVGGILIGSSTWFYLEFDNIKTIAVDDFTFHQYNVGDEYIITRSRLKTDNT